MSAIGRGRAGAYSTGADWMVKVVGLLITAASEYKFVAARFIEATISARVAVAVGVMVSVGVMVAVIVPETVGVAVTVGGKKEAGVL